MRFVKRVSKATAPPVTRLPPERIFFFFHPSLTLTISPRPPQPRSQASEVIIPSRLISERPHCPGRGLPEVDFLKEVVWPRELPAGCTERRRGANGNQTALLLKLPKVADYRLV